MFLGGVFYVASAHAAGSRLGIALIAMLAFGAIASTRWQRPVRIVPVLVLCLIVAGWLFGATLVWGTGYATKVRWSAAWTFNGDAWEWTALLVVALGGVVFLGFALRAFAGAAPRRGWLLSGASGVAFVTWSAVVRYSVAVAIFVLVAGAVAVAFLGHQQPAIATGGPAGRRPARVAIPLLLAAIVVGLAWAFYAFGWLVLGPEGHPSCNCWADYYNDWQYQVQFLVALAGALSLVAAAALYVMRRRGAVGMTGTVAASALCGWIIFLVTGSG